MYKKIFKRPIDLILSIVCFALLLPLFLLVAFLVKIDSEGPIFFFQNRLGLNGKIFKIYKFRTMTNEMRTPNKEIFANNSEVTKTGKILRRFKIDELPQLLNIIKGDMSIVGPRPGLVNQINELDQNGQKRLLVRPGLTGLAQINGNIYLSWKERWKYDRIYVENITFLGDLKIILKTIQVIVLGEKNIFRKNG